MVLNQPRVVARAGPFSSQNRFRHGRRRCCVIRIFSMTVAHTALWTSMP